MNNNISAFAATETGYNHIKINKVCEDASDYYDNDRMHICVVADGHGSDNYPRTDYGAKCAVDAAIYCITDFVDNADPQDVLCDEKHGYSLLLQLARSILNEWHIAIEEDAVKRPFTEHELEIVSEKYRKYYLADNDEERRIEKAYGCTLIAFVVTEAYSFGLHIGDGKCVMVDQEGNFSEPIPWDDDCQQNVTTSICDSDAIDEFRFYVTEDTPAAVFCGSDGIEDSYSSTGELYAFYRSILKIFVEHGSEVGQNEIKEYLPVLTKRGSGDDVSVGLILNNDLMTSLAPLMNIQAQLYRLNSMLEEKKYALITSTEKIEALSAKLQNLLTNGKNITETASRIDEVREQVEGLQKEIADLKKQIDELNKQQQEVIYDQQTASFEETLEPGVNGQGESASESV